MTELRTYIRKLNNRLPEGSDFYKPETLTDYINESGERAFTAREWSFLEDTVEGNITKGKEWYEIPDSLQVGTVSRIVTTKDGKDEEYELVGSDFYFFERDDDTLVSVCTVQPSSENGSLTENIFLYPLPEPPATFSVTGMTKWRELINETDTSPTDILDDIIIDLAYAKCLQQARSFRQQGKLNE